MSELLGLLELFISVYSSLLQLGPAVVVLFYVRFSELEEKIVAKLQVNYYIYYLKSIILL